ncbi:unnamed protein product [Lactuca saligna]|uniref:Uncharacterized protein n=1 Tax=Lactuca saligna TaxID=75948 RepID=A0AA35YNK5_LACSI|nr:unnamed protein product [Lactuca saligna]
MYRSVRCLYNWNCANMEDLGIDSCKGSQSWDAGEAWIICRRIEVLEEDGCVLESANGNPTFDFRKSELVPINVIDFGKVKVEAPREVHKQPLAKKLPNYNVTVGRCFQPIYVLMFDTYSNQIPFFKVPEVVVKVECNKGVNLKVYKWSPSISFGMSALILKDLIIGSSN